MEPDSDFERFCERLEDLRNDIGSYRTREGLTARILGAIRIDRRRQYRAQMKEWIAPAAVAGVVMLLWFFFRTTLRLKV